MNTFYMMIGLPASGKGIFAEKLASRDNSLIVETDAIRKELYGDENIQGDRAVVHATAQERILEQLKKGGNAIYDATNVSYKKRKAFLERVPNGVEKVAVMVWCPVAECVDNNASRERVVPWDVIFRMWKEFDVPFYAEGWDRIVYINNNRNRNYIPDPAELRRKMFSFSQDNPNHVHTVGIHQERVADHVNSVVNDSENVLMNMTALWHDNGKLWTKGYVNGRGEETNVAHYFNHENVGAYEMVGILLSDGRWDNVFVEGVTSVIRFHMRPYFFNGDKSIERFKRLVGEKTFNRVMLLNEADRKGKGGAV